MGQMFKGYQVAPYEKSIYAMRGMKWVAGDIFSNQSRIPG
jgi:hypothetical protein